MNNVCGLFYVRVFLEKSKMIYQQLMSRWPCTSGGGKDTDTDGLERAHYSDRKYLSHSRL